MVRFRLSLACWVPSGLGKRSRLFQMVLQPIIYKVFDHLQSNTLPCLCHVGITRSVLIRKPAVHSPTSNSKQPSEGHVST